MRSKNSSGITWLKMSIFRMAFFLAENRGQTPVFRLMENRGLSPVFHSLNSRHGPHRHARFALRPALRGFHEAHGGALRAPAGLGLPPLRRVPQDQSGGEG